MQEWAAILGRDKVGSHGKVRKPGIQLRDFGRAGGAGSYRGTNTSLGRGLVGSYKKYKTVL